MVSPAESPLVCRAPGNDCFVPAGRLSVSGFGLTFTTAPALQLGVAYALEHEMDFTLSLTKDLQSKRNLLATGLARLGFEVLPCEGTYFLTAGIRTLTNEPDRVFCERLTREAGVALIPLSAFFDNALPDHLVRFAFCKNERVLEEALKRLDKYLGTRNDELNA